MSSSQEENAKFEAKYAGMSAVEAVKAMAEIQNEKDVIEGTLKSINKEFDFLRLNLIPALFEDEGITNLTIDDVGRVTITGDLYVSIPADKKEEAYLWLGDTGHGGLVTQTVNASSLKAAMKQMIKKGEEVPEALFKLTPFSRASIARARGV